MENNISSDNESNQNSKKRRGRPRKSNGVEHVDKTKRRGKKVKEYGTYIKHEEDNDDDKEEEIILKIPLNINELDDSEDGTSSDDDENSKNRDIFQKIDHLPQKKMELCIDSSCHISGNNVFTINDSDSDDDTEDIGYENGILENGSTSNSLKKRLADSHTIIKKLQDELDSIRNRRGINEYNVHKMKMELIIKDVKTGETKICDNTNICCWWCTYNFKGSVYFIPDKLVGESYHVFGCFCSYNCAATYNLNMNDYNIWGRYSLLKKMYEPYITDIDSVVLAPAREVFDRFGGILSHDEYIRNVGSHIREYRMTMPPLVPIMPYIEVTTGGKHTTGTNHNQTSNLVLKRSKPLPNTKNTFEFGGLVKKKIAI